MLPIISSGREHAITTLAPDVSMPPVLFQTGQESIMKGARYEVHAPEGVILQEFS